MSKRALTPAAAMEIKRLRTERNDWGEAKWSAAEIAEKLGVSESTVWRVLKKRAAYSAMRELPSEEEAAASLARFKEMMAQAQPQQQSTSGAVPPPNLLDELGENDDAAN